MSRYKEHHIPMRQQEAAKITVVDQAAGTQSARRAKEGNFSPESGYQRGDTFC